MKDDIIIDKHALTVPHHVLHADADLAIAVESTIEANNVRWIALMKHHQLTNDLVTNGWLDFQVYELQQHSAVQHSTCSLSLTCSHFVYEMCFTDVRHHNKNLVIKPYYYGSFH